jgi:hypothetical protein
MEERIELTIDYIAYNRIHFIVNAIPISECSAAEISINAKNARTKCDSNQGWKKWV